MTYIVLELTLLLFGLAYAIKPEKFLKLKYLYEDIPELTIKSARVVGVLMAVAGAAMLLYTLFQQAAA